MHCFQNSEQALRTVWNSSTIAVYFGSCGKSAMQKCSKTKYEHKILLLAPQKIPSMYLIPLLQLEKGYLHMLFNPAEMIQGPVTKITTDTKRLPYQETVKILKLFSLEIKQTTWSMIDLYQAMNTIEEVTWELLIAFSVQYITYC